MDKIILSGARLEVHLGVSEAERAALQVVVADVELEVDARPAGLSDDFMKTIDYAAVHETVRRTATSRGYALIEAMAEEMAAAVLEEFEVGGVRILIRKPAALQARGVDWAGVEVVRRRRG
jgi:7,8-dihydroneopterin aldolase/epimerase/oxygenase